MRQSRLSCVLHDRRKQRSFRPENWEGGMTAFNIVRFRVKPGHQQQFIAAHRAARPNFKGFRGGALVRTGEQTFCIVGEWASFAKLVQARPQMIGLLDTLRQHLEDLGGGLGLTDPVSGEMVLKLQAAKPAAKKRAKAKAGKRKKRR
jgi:antibiotic biosynthesis monooxygenase